MKKTKLTRSLLAACSIVALSAVMYGCAHTDSGPSQEELDAAKAETAAAAAEAAANAAEAEANAAAAAAAQAEADAAAAAQAEAEAAAAAAAEAEAAAEAQAAADAAAAAEAAAAQAAAEAQAAADAADAAEANAAAAAAAAAEAEAEAARIAAEEAAQVLQDAADVAEAKAASATAAALKRALGATPLASLEPLTDAQPPATGGDEGQGAVPSITPAGLMLGYPAHNLEDRKAETVDGPPRVQGASRSERMAPGDSAGMLGDWAGTHYSKTYPRSKRSHSAVAFRNRTDPIMTPFAAGATLGKSELHFETAYTRATRTLSLNYDEFPADDVDGAAVAATPGDPIASFAIEGDMFPTAGTIEYVTASSGVQSVTIPGTYQGAEGDYHCTFAADTACTAEATSGGIDLGGRWLFVHDEGAGVTHLDPNYLFFGWWLYKGSDGEPSVASAFTGVAGTIDFSADPIAAITGSAKYAGHAAGKFAISNPIGDDAAGHFTADAGLTATFGLNYAPNTPNNGGVTGTLDNFMLNDAEEAVDWEVTLRRALWTANADGNASEEDAFGLTQPGTPQWHIGDGSADASGSWSAQFYDETDDGDNVPTSVTGSFHSEFGEFMTMVGAFGAERTE